MSVLLPTTFSLIGRIARWKAQLVAVSLEGPIVRLNVDCGFPLVASLSRHDFEALAIPIGETVTASVQSTAVKILGAESRGAERITP